MSGRHHNDLPEGTRGDDGIEPVRPVFGPANDGSSEWFGPRTGQDPQAAGPGVPPGDPAGGAAPQAQPGGAVMPTGDGQAAGPGAVPDPGAGGPPQAGGSETPDWFTPRQSAEQPVFGAGGFSGASDAGGYGLGRPAAASNMYGPAASEPMPPSGGGPASPSGSPGGGYGQYESLRSSDSGPTGYPDGGSAGSGGYGAYASGGSGGYGSGPGGPGGPGGSGGPGGPGGSGGPGGPGGGAGGSGGYGSGEYGGGRRKRRRSAGALIGPMAGAVGLALLLGVGVYAFAEVSGGCAEDNALVLEVAAASDIQPAVVKAAQRFNDARHKVDGKCAQAKVAKAEPASVAPLLSGQAVPTATNRRPDVWIPDSSLWASLVRSSDKGKQAVKEPGTSLASSPIVVGMPRTLAMRLREQGITSSPSWDNLLNAAGGTPGGAVTKNQVIPAGSVRLLVPDPARNGAGMGALMVTNTLLTNDPNRNSIFTGIVRTVRESMVPTVQGQFAYFRKGRTGKQPISLSSEQAVYTYNRTGPAEPAVALYPVEGTLSLDYPFTVTAGDGAKRKAAELLERELTNEKSRQDVQALGFRTPDGKAPGGFGQQAGVSAARPRKLPSPKDADVTRVMQAWSKLTLGLRILTVIDVSGSMAEKVGPNTTRLQAVAQLSQGGLSMMSNDTELGTWVFSTKLQGDQDYREIVSIGPLGERVGSSTRRNLVLSGLGQIKPRGDTGLYDTVLAAYKKMSDTYKPEFGNSILLLTDGKNEDTGGPTLQQTLTRLKAMVDPNKPIQVNMIGFGPGTDRNELQRIAALTNGDVQVAQTPQEISKIFLKMLSRRIGD